MKCDICGTTENIAGVASSSLGPMSMCYCRDCLFVNAEPYNLMLYTYVDVGNCNKENLADWVKSLSTWKDDKYLTFDQFVDQLTAIEIEAMISDMNKFYEQE